MSSNKYIQESFGMLIIHPSVDSPLNTTGAIKAKDQKQLSSEELYLHHNNNCHYRKTINTIEKKKIDSSSIENSFNEMVLDSPLHKERLLIVIDSANVGYNYGNNTFNAKGIEIAIKYFQSLKFDVKAFIPISYYKSKPRDKSIGNAKMQTEDAELIEFLVLEGLLAGYDYHTSYYYKIVLCNYCYYYYYSCSSWR